MAGADLPAEERALHRAIDRLGRTARNSVANDTFAILRAGTDEGWGVAVVVGAGINCVGRSPDGRRARFASLGADHRRLGRRFRHRHGGARRRRAVGGRT